LAVGLGLLALYGLVQAAGFHLPAVLDLPRPARATTFGDFDYFFAAAERFLHDPASLYDRKEVLAFMGYVYPPVGVLFFVPFALLGKKLGFVAFLLVSVGCGYLAAWLMVRWIAPRPAAARPGSALLFLLAVVASTPFYANLVLVQFNLVVLCCCAGALLAAGRGHALLAGLLLMLACWMKIYPVVLLLVMLSLPAGRPAAVRAIVLGLALPVLLAPVLPFGLYGDYFLDALPRLSGQSLVQIDNQSITAGLSRLALPLGRWPDYIIVPTALPVRLANLAVATTLIGVLACRGAATGEDHPRTVALALAALACTPLLSPLGWGHAYVYAIPLLAWLVVYDNRRMPRLFGALAWLALLVPAYHVFPALGGGPWLAGAAVYSRYTLAVLAAILLVIALPPQAPKGAAARMARSARKFQGPLGQDPIARARWDPAWPGSRSGARLRATGSALAFSDESSLWPVGISKTEKAHRK
jgi:hypothetical protein